MPDDIEITGQINKPSSSDANNDVNRERPSRAINLNLTIPQEEAKEGFSFREFVSVIYNARRFFIISSLIGLALGAVLAVFMFTGNLRSQAVTASLTLNYSRPLENVFPSGNSFDIESFYTPVIWENALAHIGRSDIEIADAMSQMHIQNIKYAENFELLISSTSNRSVLTTMVNNFLILTEGNSYKLTLSDSNDVFKNRAEKQKFLTAFCNEYRAFIIGSFFSGDRIGMLHGQFLKDWVELTETDIIFSGRSYSIDFRLLSERYVAMAQILNELHDLDPQYTDASGKSFLQYAEELENIIAGDLADWLYKIDSDIYIRGAETFMQEYDLIIAALEVDLAYYREMFTAQNDLLYSYGQSVVDNDGTAGAVEVMAEAFEYAEKVAVLQRELSRMEMVYDAMNANAGEVTSRSETAEIAFNGLAARLDEYEKTMHDLIYSYYEQRNPSDAEQAIIFTTPANVTLSSRFDNILIALTFLGFTAVGVLVGLIGAYVKKHLPEKCQADEAGDSQNEASAE